MSFRSNSDLATREGGGKGPALAQRLYRQQTDQAAPYGAEADRLFASVDVPPETQSLALPIPGLEIVPNTVQPQPVGHAGFATWVDSGVGDVIGHFVTHGPQFEYQDFGTHVGQIDRLTFLAADEREIEAFFVDCRQDAPSFGRKLRVRLKCSPHRKLVIPCGVAHSFRNLAGVLTRNDLTLLIAPDNPQWNALNDNIVFPWSLDGITGHPAVVVNTIRLPLPLALGFYDLQRQSLAPVEADNNTKAVEPGAGHAVTRVPALQFGPAGADADWRLTYFSEIGPQSWMVIPGTSGCAQRLCMVDLDQSDGTYVFAPSATVMMLTVLEGTRPSAHLTVLDDTAPNTPINWPVDPRYQLIVPAGAGLQVEGEGILFVRLESNET